MKKRYILCFIIFVIIFSFFYYKNQKSGNTIIKIDKEKVIENILKNGIKYKAKAKVKVYSNKNENEYEINIVENGNNNRIEVYSHKDISGLIIEKKNEDLVIKNSKLKLDKIYNNYKEITDNALFLNTFVKEIEKNNREKIVDDNKNFLIKLTLKDYTKYIKYKELYFNKSTNMPVKLIIKDSSNKPRIIIEYTNMEML